MALQERMRFLLGVESRTSSPLRMVRDGNGESNVRGLFYPCGEGAGYAGGITSAAMDGIRAAEWIAARFLSVIRCCETPRQTTYTASLTASLYGIAVVSVCSRSQAKV